MECKAYAIRQEFKKKTDGLSGVDEAEKNILLQRRVTLFQNEGKKKETPEEAFRARVKSMTLYKKAFAMFCAGTAGDHTMCSNELMIKTYGPNAKIPTEMPKLAATPPFG